MNLPEAAPTIALKEVAWTLERPRTNAHDTFGRRCGVQVTIRHRGRAGVGLAAPLPGYGDDSLARARAALEALDGTDAFRATLDGGSIAAIEGWVDDTPSAAFALAGAILEWRAARDGAALAAQLGPCGPIASAAWVQDPEELADAIAIGFRTVKVKRTRGAWRPLVAAARGAGIGVRVDTNGVELTPEEWNWLAAHEVEFVEDPTPDVLRRAWHDAPLPVALDLPVATASDSAVLAALDRGVRVLVLKPMLLGVARTLRLAEAARARGAGVVVSHLLDGPIAGRLHGAIAMHLRGDLAHGLGRRPTWAPGPESTP